MRVILALCLVGLECQARSQLGADSVTDQQARMDNERAEFYARKYANHPRASATTDVKDQISMPSAPMASYTQAPDRAEIYTHQPPSQTESYSSYPEEGADTRPGARGNDSARLFGLSSGSQDLQLGLQFTVPFLSLPLGALLGQHGDWSSLLAVGWPGLLAVGAVLLAAVVFVPWLVGKVTGGGRPSYLDLSSYGRTDRGDTDAPTLLARLDDALRRHDIDSTECMQRGVCSYVRAAARSVEAGRAPSADLIVDGLASNSYVNWWLDGTSLQEATTAGRSGASCVDTYARCPLTANSVYRALAEYVGGAI